MLAVDDSIYCVIAEVGMDFLNVAMQFLGGHGAPGEEIDDGLRKNGVNSRALNAHSEQFVRSLTLKLGRKLAKSSVD